MLNTYTVTPQVFGWIDVALRRKQAHLVQLCRTVDSDSRLHVCMMGRPAASGDRRLIVTTVSEQSAQLVLDILWTWYTYVDGEKMMMGVRFFQHEGRRGYSK